MNKPTQKQLNRIKNAKTKEEALKAYAAIANHTWKEYKAIQGPAKKAYMEWEGNN